MVEQRQRSLILFGRIQAALGGIIALVIFALFGLNRGLLSDTGVSLTTATLGVAAVIYFLTIHFVISKKWLELSTLILTCISVTNIILIIIQTQGLDSPYYSLWLLVIVAAGVFGTSEIIVLVSVSLIYYCYEIFFRGGFGLYLRDHILQLILTLVAGALAEWVHSRSAHDTAQTTKLESLSGQLNQEQLKAQVLMGSIGEGVIVVNTQRQIQLFNKAAQTITGWEEVSAQNLDYNLVLGLKTQDEKQLTEANDPVWEAWVAKAPIVRNNLAMTTRSGRKIQVSISVSPIIDGNGEITGAIALFRDISQEKEVERQRDEFVSTASHEMRTPVAAIEGYISLAMNVNVATIDDRARNYLEKAHDTIQHLGELFRDLLSVAKAEEGQLNAKISVVSLGELVQSAVDDMQFVAQKKNLTLVNQISDVAGAKALAPIYYVAVNPERLREVVMNLIDNAIKFTPQGGIKVSLSGDKKEVKVGVSDSGVGISPDDSPHLFQKFYRIDNSATRTIGGTGLGLYLCRTVIELFNGRIWVESKFGEGSTFFFSLPRLSEDEAKRLMIVPANTEPQPAAQGAMVPVVVQPQAPSAPARDLLPLPQPSAGPAMSQPIPMPVPNYEEPHEHRQRLS